MNRKKKLISLLLLFTMIITILPAMGVFASTSNLDNTELEGIVAYVRTASSTWEVKTLSSNFDPAIRNYNLDLGADYTSIYFHMAKSTGVDGQTATANIEGKDYLVTDYPDRFETKVHRLTQAISVFTITIKSKDGSTSGTYKITIKRGNSIPRALCVINGTADNTSPLPGDRVTITADEAEEGKKFAGWFSDDIDTTHKDRFIFTMPDKDVLVKANYARDPGTTKSLVGIKINLKPTKDDLYTEFPLTPNFDPDITEYTVETLKNYKFLRVDKYLYTTWSTDPITVDVVINQGYSTSWEKDGYPIEDNEDQLKVTLNVYNQNDQSQTPQQYNITIKRSNVVIKPTILGEEKLPDGIVGLPYKCSLSASGTSTMEWQLSSGTLPAGLTISGNTISGKPTSSSYKEFTVKASNSAGSDSTSKSINIAPSPVNSILLGNVVIDGEEKYGETLTCSVENANTSNLTYKWTREGGGALGNGPIYTINNKTVIGERLTCEVTSIDFDRDDIIKATTNGPILKADGPKAPTDLVPREYISLGHKYYEIENTTIHMEYATNTEFTDAQNCEDWITDVELGTYYIRLKGTDTHNVGKYVQVEVGDEIVPISVSISPATASVQKGTTQEFDANVIGLYDNVDWRVDGNKSLNTKINQSGLLTVGADETSKKLTVTARSRHDNTKSAKSIINVVDTPVEKYILTIINGEDDKTWPDDKDYQAGEIANVTKNNIAGKEFVEWTSPDMDIHEDSANDPTWSFQMPNRNVILIANYKDITGPAKEKLTGTVSITGIAQVYEELTASVIDSNTNDLKYEWIAEGRVSSSQYLYIDDSVDVGHVLICKVTSDAKAGSIIGVGGIISRLDGFAAPENLIPQIPTSLGGTDGKIIGTEKKMEYATDIKFTDAQDCQDGETQGLKADTYYVRYKEDFYRDAGDYAIVIIPENLNKVTGESINIYNQENEEFEDIPAYEGEYEVQTRYVNSLEDPISTYYIVTLKSDNRLINIDVKHKILEAGETYTFKNLLNIPSIAEYPNLEIKTMLWDDLKTLNIISNSLFLTR